MLDYCFTLHVLVQPSKRLQGGANDQQKCVHSRVKKQNITYWLKREFLQTFKVKNSAVNRLPQRRVSSRKELKPQSANSTARPCHVTLKIRDAKCFYYDPGNFSDNSSSKSSLTYQYLKDFVIMPSR